MRRIDNPGTAVDPSLARRLIVEAEASDRAIDDVALDVALGLRIAMLRVAWPPADVYCMMNAVLPRLLPPVLIRLEQEARERRIVVASVSTSNEAFAQADWLRELQVMAEGIAGRELRMWESV